MCSSIPFSSFNLFPYEVLFLERHRYIAWNAQCLLLKLDPVSCSVKVLSLLDFDEFHIAHFFHMKGHH